MEDAQVLKSGDWKTEEDIPYTEYFEKTRTGKSSDKKYQKDVPSNSKLVSDSSFIVQAPSLQTEDRNEELRRPEVARPKHEHKISSEESDLQQSTDSPPHHDQGRRTAADSVYQRHNGMSPGDTPKRNEKPVVGTERRSSRSPLHPDYQAKIGAKGSAASSPSWERKGSSEGSHGLGPSTPGRSRLRSAARSNETPESGAAIPKSGAAIPKFGGWDEKDPSAADGYSGIFTRVREERHNNAGIGPPTSSDSLHSTGRRHYASNESKGCCCFSWGRN